MSKQFQFQNRPLDWAASPHDFTGDNQLKIHTAETTQRYVLGTRKMSWDGRLYKYSLSNGICHAGRGAMNNQAPYIADNGNTHPANTTVVGDTSFTIATQTVAEDALAGGYVILYTNSEAQTQFRGIVGNTLGAGTTITLELDGPLTAVATVDSTDMCAYYSPYYGLMNDGTTISRTSVLCVPAEYVSASGKYFWGQTYGPIRVTPGVAGFGNATGERMMVFGENGSLFLHNGALATTLQYQHAGFIIPLTASADDAPLLMLQISI